ncbi:RNA-binding domain-containing protein [Leptolyngbyaceae cyanobacterium UHCC 1019]
MSLNFQNARNLLYEFRLHDLFIQELGWSQPSSSRPEALEVDGQTYTRTRIAEMSGVPVFEMTAPDGEIPIAETRLAIYQAIAQQFAENLLIFINQDRTRSLWYWAKREGAKIYPRTEVYLKNQPADLILSKIGGLRIELEELDADGNLSVVDVAARLQRSLDVETVTKNFYKEFQAEHQRFIQHIQGIDQESDRRWYTSVVLNRLMFVYFLQKKGFIGNGDLFYLENKLAESQQRGEDLFYGEFLQTLFFSGFAKPQRSDRVAAMIGQVPYLNGGLFLEHSVEQRYRNQIAISDDAFEQIFALFKRYSWHLDDRPGGKPNEINPDVLGYIFEKYINQKAFGAYYTRPEITEYLCDRTINKLILDRVNTTLIPPNATPLPAGEGLGVRAFDSIGDLLVKLDVNLCRQLIHGEDAILRTLSLLDPACGSAAFLIAAMKTLIPIYNSIIGTIKLSTDPQLTSWLKQVERDHPSLPYFIKKRIITDNLYGVDIMEEAVEIAKLRLFLTLVTSAQTVDDLEPLPNIDFNIMVGNSLIGLMRVDEEGFDQIRQKAKGKRQKEEVLQGNLLQPLAASQYQAILAEKNRSIASYKEHSFRRGKVEGTEQEDRLQMLRDHIDRVNRESQEKLNQLLLAEFQKLKIQYEQAQPTGKAKKRLLTLADIEALKPFHWGYHFDKVLERGGFDAIITNPPWEVFKPDGKEFFTQYSDLVTKKKMDLQVFQDKQKQLLQDAEIANVWLSYQSQFPHTNLYFRLSQQYKNQISIVNSKKVKVDLNLYKLFLEQCFNLLCKRGECGIVIPSSIYTDLGTKQLRDMLFEQTKVTGLFCFENRKEIFEGVHRSYKFTILTFEKESKTRNFPVAFMRRDVYELENFPDEASLYISVDLVRKLSPDSLSIMEFKSKLELQIAEKIAIFPLLGESIKDKWSVVLGREFHMTDNRELFEKNSGANKLSLYEGKCIHQFTHCFSKPRFWVNEQRGRKALLKKDDVDSGQVLNYQSYRLGFRDITASTNQRTLISSVVPKNVFTGNTLTVSKNSLDGREVLFIVAIFSSFVCDFVIRQKVTNHCSFFYVYQLPVPRLVEGDRYFSEICDRAAKLICTTPEFDDLWEEVKSKKVKGKNEEGEEVKSKKVKGKNEESKNEDELLPFTFYPLPSDAERGQLRAELDGMIAHLYGLTADEFQHILSTFPIVPAETKQAALEAYHQFTPTVGDPEILDLIASGESAQLEFKSTARWNLQEHKKDRTMEEVVLKTVAAFLNAEGGTLLIGVEDSGTILGLQLDYQTLQKKNRDGFELWLMNDLLLKELGKELAPCITVNFHSVDQKEVCRIDLGRAPQPVYINIRNSKTGQLEEDCLFVRTGNLTSRFVSAKEIANYTKTHWG